MIERELTHLFGPDVLQECWQVPTAIRAGQAKRVAILADMLSNAKSPEAKRGLVMAMPPNDRVLLCRWLADRDFAGNCVSTGK